MNIGDPVVSFVLLLLIGIVAGLIVERFAGPSWLTRQIAGASRGFITAALVGIAGSFVGYHLATLARTGGGSLVPFVAAAAVALVVVWAWRKIRF